MRALLDVNVLIALLDVDHVHHDAARTWLKDHIELGWASCPITQNGVLRIMSQTSYPNSLTTGAVTERLRTATQARHHQFWPDSVSLIHPAVLKPRQAVTSKQITDLYLLALAVSKGGRLVTFDARISSASVAGADDRHLCAISSAPLGAETRGDGGHDG
ncbi:MAG: PIN domain-containing protein [Spirochaetaceae bacterium]|nr:PIN domain-containing protein [Spirochaetaceae bacterium]